jgi:hypothetical protein
LENDRKIPQDLVATVSMSAFAIRGHFHVNIESLINQKSPVADETTDGMRRKTEEARTRRSSKARQAQYPTQ